MILSVAWLAIALAVQDQTNQTATKPLLPLTPDVVVPDSLETGISPVGAAQNLSVNEVVAIALRQQPAVIIAIGNQWSAQGQTKQAAAAANPQISVGASVSNSNQLSGGSSGGTGSGGTGGTGTGGTGSGGGSSSGTFLGTSAQLQLLLFDFGKTREQIREQEFLEKAADQALTQAQSDAVLAVKNAFYELTQDQSFEAEANSNVANRQAELALAFARVNVGSGAPSDLVQAKSSLADAVNQQTVARATAQTSRWTLLSLMGVDPRLPITVTLNTEAMPPGTPDQMIGTALVNRPEVKQAQAKVEAARSGVRGARLNDAPSVALGASYGSKGQLNPFDSQTDQVAVNLTWNILDGGLTAGKVRSAQGNLLVNEQQLRQTTLAVTQDVMQQVLNVKSAEQRVTTSIVQVANARELVRIQEGRYSGGLGQFLDVTTAEDALDSAEKNLIQAQSDLQKARAALKHSMGPTGPLPLPPASSTGTK